MFRKQPGQELSCELVKLKNGPLTESNLKELAKQMRQLNTKEFKDAKYKDFYDSVIATAEEVSLRYQKTTVAPPNASLLNQLNNVFMSFDKYPEVLQHSCYFYKNIMELKVLIDHYVKLPDSGTLTIKRRGNWTTNDLTPITEELHDSLEEKVSNVKARIEYLTSSLAKYETILAMTMLRNEIAYYKAELMQNVIIPLSDCRNKYDEHNYPLLDQARRIGRSLEMPLRSFHTAYQSKRARLGLLYRHDEIWHIIDSIPMLSMPQEEKTPAERCKTATTQIAQDLKKLVNALEDTPLEQTERVWLQKYTQDCVQKAIRHVHKHWFYALCYARREVAIGGIHSNEAQSLLQYLNMISEQIKATLSNANYLNWDDEKRCNDAELKGLEKQLVSERYTYLFAPKVTTAALEHAIMTQSDRCYLNVVMYAGKQWLSPEESIDGPPAPDKKDYKNDRQSEQETEPLLLMKQKTYGTF